jgi:hypothetical protein
VRRYVLPAALAALISGAIVAYAVVPNINPQNCQNQQACIDMNAQLLPLLNGTGSFSPANWGLTTIAALGTTCTAAQKGQMQVVTDALITNGYNGIATGSGALTIAVLCNGTNWTNH